MAQSSNWLVLINATTKFMGRFFAFAVLALLITNKSASCQSLINNDSVAFKVLRKSLSIEDDGNVIPSTFLIFVKLESNKRDKLKAFSRDEWLNLLADDNTDWAANLILYDLFKRDATSFAYGEIKNRGEWIKCGRYEDDMSYWKKYFNGKVAIPE